MRSVTLRLIGLMLLLFGLSAATLAATPEEKEATRARKALAKAQRKMLEQEVHRFEKLRDQAIIEYFQVHKPAKVFTPTIFNDLRVSKVMCVGDYITGLVTLYFEITPLFGEGRLFMGGERNGTSAYDKGGIYPSSDHYGRIYTLRGGEPTQIYVTYLNVTPGSVDSFDRIDVSMGLQIGTLSIITMLDVPVFWTYSDKAISNFVKEKSVAGQPLPEVLTQPTKSKIPNQ